MVGLRSKLFVLAFLILTKCGHSQSQAGQWTFGDGAILDFTSFSASLVNSRTQIDAPEGSAALSDVDGRLLFYTNGEEIRDRFDQLFENGNGLRGNKNCSQPAIIVARPGMANVYYVFTVTGENDLSPGLYYHIVEFDDQAGSGKVISKNNYAGATSDEKLTAAFQAATLNTWIFTLSAGKIQAFLVTAAGVNGPIVSGGGYIGRTDNSGGMKVSPNGKHLAIARTELPDAAKLPRPFVELYDLNTDNGTVSSLKTISVPALETQTNFLYGLSFSPANTLLYVSTFDPTLPVLKNNMVYMINLTTRHATARILYRAESNYGAEGGLGGGLQLGPDKKIYFLTRNYPKPGKSSITVIQCPDDSISAVNSFVIELPNNKFRGFPNYNEMIFDEPDPSIHLDAGPDIATCSDVPARLGVSANNDLHFSWSPNNFINDSHSFQPIFKKQLIGELSQSITYVVTASRTTCPSSVVASDTVMLTLLPEPTAPSIIHGPRNICENARENITYYVDSISNVTYEWNVLNGHLDNHGASVEVDWASPFQDASLNVFAKSIHGCEGRPTSLTISWAAKPPMHSIDGSASVCPHVHGVKYWIEHPDHSLRYEWRSNGGNAIINDRDTATVDWADTTPDASMEVSAINEQGCSTRAKFPVKVMTEIKPEIPFGDTLICLNKKDKQPYSVYDRPGSYYNWKVQGGSIRDEGGKNSVLVDWLATGLHQVWVEEKSTTIDTVCFGVSDTLLVHVFKDTSSLHLLNVSVAKIIDASVLIDIQTQNGTFETIDILRSENFSSVYSQTGTVIKEDFISYRDDHVSPDSNIYNYLLQAENGCGELIFSAIHNTILLEIEKIGTDSIVLSWNRYHNWPGGVTHYKIFRSISEGGEFTLFQTVRATDTTIITPTGTDSFFHSFYIQANDGSGNQTSYSNIVETSYEHPLYVPNVITPNGDSFNETFEIPKIKLYPDNLLKVFNKAGKIVYECNNYAGGWNGNGMAAGTYYYVLYLSSGKLIKGWVQIQK